VVLNNKGGGWMCMWKIWNGNRKN